MADKRVKIFTVLSVLLILIALPALSWLYLNRGAEWRKAGLAEMSDKRTFEYNDLMLVGEDGEAFSFEAGRFAIATKAEPGTTELRETITKLAEQFDHLSNIDFVYFGSSALEATDWIHIDCSASECDKITTQLFQGSSNTALIDDSLYIRGVYDIASEPELVSLVEHGAILFPPEKRAKIELKRGADQ